ncbi:MAG: sigma-70 family RNA polymerase sigma factor [Bacteroidales bacterium]|nr:sigma-70 family RNA polymerase sigma factor [Bacteroidales bacterium]
MDYLSRCIVANYTNEEIIIGIRNRDSATLQYIYKTFYPIIREFVVRNHGKADDAKDVFQEALVVIFRKTQEEDINLHSSFTNYIYTVSRFIWLKMLKRRRLFSTKVIEIIRPMEIESNDIRDIEISMERKVYQYYFSKLGKDCREILTLFYHEMSFREIAIKLGKSSEEYVRKRKHACKEQLIKMIKSDPDVRNFFED